jgi:hypothetical protein
MALSIGKMFHVVHVAESLGPLDSWYDEVFAPVRGIMDGNYLPHEKRDGSLIALGDSIIETMAPADEPGAETLPVGKFFARFGRHLHSIAWYTSDVGAIWDRLHEHGVRIVTYAPGGGRPEFGDIYTHPRDTLTQLEFFEPPPSEDDAHPAGRPNDPRFDAGWPAVWAASPNPLGVARVASITVVTESADRARSVFVDMLEGRVIDESHSALTGTDSTFVAMGDETVVELAVPTDPDSLAARDLAMFGASCHAMTFQVADLDVAAAQLEKKGIAIVAQDDTTFVTDPVDTFGAVFRFTVRAVPGDPRDAGG